MDGLYDKIKRAQTNSFDLLDIIKQFKPLILKYSRLLDMEFEDAVSELTAEFIRVVLKFPANKKYSIDRFILSYLKKSMHNSYIHLSKKESVLKMEYTYDSDHYEPGYVPECYGELNDLISCLSTSQKAIILLKFFYGYSDIEIAGLLHISRQAVNQSKNRALSKLQETLKY